MEEAATKRQNVDAVWSRATGYSAVFLRAALGVSFLSAVADRFGWWGAYGQPHVAWGNFHRFTAYTGTLLWFIPEALIPAVAWTVWLKDGSKGACRRPHHPTNYCAAAADLLCAGSKRMSFASRSARALRRIC